MKSLTPFIIWKSFQRRAEAFREPMQVEPVYFHYAWEEKSKAHKVLSYVCKLVATLRYLLQQRPAAFYVQAPPIFPIYAAYVYGKFTGAKYFVDAHNPIIYGSYWSRMPWVGRMLKKSATVIVHNPYVAQLAEERKLPYSMLVDRPPQVRVQRGAAQSSAPRPRVVVPCSYDRDEPLMELQQAMALVPEADFFLTWYLEKLPPDFRAGLSANVHCTGFLPQERFDDLLAQADAILVLTTHEGTQPSGATEALAFERPLVVSDLKIIRALFPRGAVYVHNHAAAMAAGIRQALQQRDTLAEEMAAFKLEKLQAWEAQYQALQAKAGLSNGVAQ